MADIAFDLVSPLPPVRSGIADYSADLLPHLARHADLRLIRLPGQEVDSGLAERFSLAPAESLGEGGRLPLYQMGNNRHHEGVLRLALDQPGVLTLHDLVLHHLLVESTLGHGDVESYRQRLTADHGWIGELTARARRWGELGSAALFELPASRTLLRRQRGVLVHSEWAARRVREEAAVEVRTIPMGVPLPPPVDSASAAEFRDRYRLPADARLLGSFGFQTPIKRTEVVIRALARPELAAAHLVIVGEVSKVLDFEDEARQAGVADRVHITGFIDFREFEAAIAACDVCLNLRYPTAGETSASLLRVLAVGRPVVVSDYAQFSELPDAVAVKVPLGDREEELLAAGLGELLADPARLDEMGREARRLVARDHDPARAAERLVEAARELADREPPGDAPLEVPPPSTLVWLELDGAVEVAGGEAPWREGERRSLRVRLHNRGFGSWLPTRDDPGGVLVEVRWRGGDHDPPLEQQWVKLPRKLDPGERFDFETETRRPAGAGQLVIEPHIAGVSGFGRLGGPFWLGRYREETS